jgi:hypothetical protein
LKFGFIRRAEGAAKIERNPERLGRLNLLGVRTNEADLRCGDSFFLEIMG